VPPCTTIAELRGSSVPRRRIVESGRVLAAPSERAMGAKRVVARNMFRVFLPEGIVRITGVPMSP